MLFKKKTNFYSSNLNDSIAQIRKGDIRYLPWIFCVFSENSDKHKLIAARTLNELINNCSVDDIYKIDKQMRDTASMEWSVNWRSLKF
jgi:hypothetical protein